jgi:hypothetical protein
MATIKYKGMELEEVTQPRLFDPAEKMLVIDELHDEPQIKYVSAILSTKSNYKVVTDDMEFYQSCFRIPDPPKPRRATNRELAKWLAQGCGEMRVSCTSNISHEHKYESIEAKDLASEFIVVRKWSDTEWHEPTVDYMGIEVNDEK